jgi:hypothetical protein
MSGMAMWLRGSGLTAVVAVLVTGCSTTSAPVGLASTRVDQFTGKTLDRALDRVDPDWALVYDLSLPILGVESTYSSSDSGDAWFIVANCSAVNGVGLGVVPRGRVDEDIRAKTAAHGYNSMLSECTKQEKER